MLLSVIQIFIVSPQLVGGGVDYDYLKERHEAHTESLREIQSYLK